METKTMIEIMGVLCLVFILAITFNTYSRYCEYKDSNGVLHINNCMEIKQFEK